MSDTFAFIAVRCPSCNNLAEVGVRRGGEIHRDPEVKTLHPDCDLPALFEKLARAAQDLHHHWEEPPMTREQEIDRAVEAIEGLRNAVEAARPALSRINPTLIYALLESLVGLSEDIERERRALHAQR
jgi:hypothetical protein